ncbi:hypothetical protein ACFXK0_19210 [Nocardia sp. NPDC059177]|uniref:hypothetical protein n=1 Tax=Nocardia sp. NPDC059177 TaxID=3346759 RepID=UPI0036C8C619
MKRVLASAGICAAIMTATTGMAAANAQLSPQIYAQPAAVEQIAGPVGSTEDFPGVALLRALGLGSSQPCDGIQLDMCSPLPGAVARPIADSGSAILSDDLVLTINQAIRWLANGSSEPCYGPVGIC